jgi:hypothetical protein
MLSMSDFPRGADLKVTRAWLDENGFNGIFIGWKADDILGLGRTDIFSEVSGLEGYRLWGFLNMARRWTRKFYCS